MSETRWSKADRAAAALQTYVQEVNGPGASYGDEGSEEFEAAVNGLLVDLKHLLYRAGWAKYMLTEMAERATDVWAEEADALPVGGDEDA